MTPDKQQQLADRLTGAELEGYRAKRQLVGIGIAAGFFIALVGYLLSGSGWWFLAPFVGFALAWRIVMGRWPFMGDRS